MKITPLDIKQKSFEKKTFGGVDKDEVQAFLNSLAAAWEKMQDEGRELRLRLEAAERESAKLREVERSLYLTLKNAEETGAGMIEQSTKAAALTAREAQVKADNLIRDAKWQAKSVLEAAEEHARKTYTNLQQEVKKLEQEYRNIEHLRDNLLGDLKNLATDIAEKADRIVHRNKSIVFSVPPPPGSAPVNKLNTDSWNGEGMENLGLPAEHPSDAGTDENGKHRAAGSFFDQV